MEPKSREAIARSVNDRLKALAAKERTETRYLQIQYALESFLRRLQASRHADRFVLKGGMLMLATGDRHRPTEDADLHRVDSSEPGDVLRIIQEVAAVPLEDEDGVEFDFSSTKVNTIREGFIPGYRVFFDARIGRSPVRMKFDVCFGDAIVPEPVMREFPSVLGAPSVRIPCYPWETVIAEKVHAMVEFGMVATRLKDFYDCAVISRVAEVDGVLAVEAMRESFGQRGTSIDPAPIGLSEAFVSARAADFDRWSKKKGPLRQPFASLEALVSELRPFLVPLCEAAAGHAPCPGTWRPGEGWREPAQALTP